METLKTDIKALFHASLYQSRWENIDIKPWIFLVLYQSAFSFSDRARLFYETNDLATFPLYLIRSLMTSPAMISPATDGTNAVDPGVLLLPVPFRSAPGIPSPSSAEPVDGSAKGVIGSSFE